MTIRTKQEAHDAIADVTYWLAGFSAGRDEHDQAGVDTARMAEQLRDVQQFIADFESSVCSEESSGD